MFIQPARGGSEVNLLQKDEILPKKTATKKAKIGSEIMQRIIRTEASIPKNDIFYRDEKKSTFLTECFADFIKHLEGEGISNQPKVMPSSTVLVAPNRIKHAWMHVLAMPWISQRKNTVRKLETVIRINSLLEVSKYGVTLFGYPLVMLSSLLLEDSDLNWFSDFFYNLSLMIGYFGPCFLLLEKILAWYCKYYLMSEIQEDFFRLDVLDDTTYFLYHHQNELPSIEPIVEEDLGDDFEDFALQLNSFESKERDGQNNLLSPEYERIRILMKLLSQTKEKLNFNAVVGNTENLDLEIVSKRNKFEKALPVVNKSYILAQLNKALRLDWYTCSVFLIPFVLLPTHQMSIFAYSYFILLEHYFDHLNVTDVLSECKKILKMESRNLNYVLNKFYDLY